MCCNRLGVRRILSCAGMCLQVLVRAKEQLGEILSACEFLDRQALEFTLQVLGSTIKDPLPDTTAPFYMVIETSGSNSGHDYAKLEVSHHLSAVSKSPHGRQGLRLAISVVQLSAKVGKVCGAFLCSGKLFSCVAGMCRRS